jgi:hypothetical protein
MCVTPFDVGPCFSCSLFLFFLITLLTDLWGAARQLRFWLTDPELINICHLLEQHSEVQLGTAGHSSGQGQFALGLLLLGMA